MEAPGEKLVPGVDGCLLRLVHQDVFFLQAQAAGVVACLKGGAVGEDPPLDVDVVMEDAFVLKGPDIASQLGVFLFSVYLKSVLWFRYLDFQSGAQTQTYFMVALVGAATSAWYTTSLSMHLDPSITQMAFLPLQLQFFSPKLVVGEATLVLWPATILPRLGMVL